MKFETFLVGGAVRDSFLGVKPKDLDFVVLAPSFAAMREELIADGAIIFVEKPEFVTIRCNHPKLGVADFACGRKESGFTDGRHPDQVEITQNLIEDLARRDFTIGAIAKNVVTGVIIDPFNGQADIQNKLIRAVGDPFKRFEEDKLRVLRGLRFSVTKGFAFDRATLDAMTEIHDFSSVSTERIVNELEEMFNANWFAAFAWFSSSRFSHFINLFNERGIRFAPTTKKPVRQNKKNFVEVMG